MAVKSRNEILLNKTTSDIQTKKIMVDDYVVWCKIGSLIIYGRNVCFRQSTNLVGEISRGGGGGGIFRTDGLFSEKIRNTHTCRRCPNDSSIFFKVEVLGTTLSLIKI